jgi:hypothetical protein
MDAPREELKQVQGLAEPVWSLGQSSMWRTHSHIPEKATLYADR